MFKFTEGNRGMKFKLRLAIGMLRSGKVIRISADGHLLEKAVRMVEILKERVAPLH